MRARWLALALALAGCTPELCSRTSDCAGGQICTPSGQCALPPDGGDAEADAGGATGDAVPDDTIPGQTTRAAAPVPTTQSREICHGRRPR